MQISEPLNSTIDTAAKRRPHRADAARPRATVPRARRRRTRAALPANGAQPAATIDRLRALGIR